MEVFKTTIQYFKSFKCIFSLKCIKSNYNVKKSVLLFAKTCSDISFIMKCEKIEYLLH